MTKDVYTVKQLAREAGVSVSWIHELISRGDIKAERLGWMYTISKAEALRWLSQRDARQG